MRGIKWRVAAAVAGLVLWSALPIQAEGIQAPTPTPYSMDLYGEIAGALPGDVVTVHAHGGALCGAFTVRQEGRYGFVHVYGDDPATAEKEGAASREPLQLRLNGAPLSPLAGEQILWLGEGRLVRVDFRR